MAKKVVEFRTNELFQVLEEKFQLKRRTEQDMAIIQHKVESIKAFLSYIDDNKLEYQDQQDQSLESWINKVRDVAYEIEDLVDHFLLNIFQHSWEDKVPSCSFFRNCKTNCQISCLLRHIRSKLKGIPNKPKKYNAVSNIMVPEKNSTMTTHHIQSSLYNLVDDTQLVGSGLRDVKEALITCLLKEEEEDSAMNRVTSIVAEGGIGKTTLANQIHHNPQIRRHFEKVVFLTLSQSLNKDEILTNMKESMKGFNPSKRCLIILDDVWQKEHWECVKQALPNEVFSYRSRFLITTRKYDVARHVAKCDSNMFHLQRLSESDSWELFRKKTFSSMPFPSQLEPICRQMVAKCEGLPLSILVLRGLLSTKNKNNIEEWVMVQRALNNNIDSKIDNPFFNQILSLAFDDLPHHLKPCFLLMSVFPENHLIEPMRLVRLWASDSNNKVTEEVAKNYLYELLNRNLIQIAKYSLDGRIMCFRIQDLIHETIVLKSREISFTEPIMKEENLTRSWPERARRLSIYEENALVPKIEDIFLSRLRSLFQFHTHSLIMSYVRDGNFKLMNVLDLKGTPLATFPESITKLFLLRYLSLRNTQISSVPASIGNLHHLETLDLKMTRVTSLPSEVSKLYKLQHLLISQYKDPLKGSPSITLEMESYGIKWKNYHDNLTHVTKLDMFRVQGFKATSAIGCLVLLQKLSIVEAPSNEEENEFFLKGLGMLTQLRRLCLVNLQNHQWGALCKAISKMSNLRSLSLNTSGKFELQDVDSPPLLLERLCLVGEMDKLPSWLCSLKKLNVMRLVGTRLKEDPSLCLKELQNLKVIGLYEALDDGVIINMPSSLSDRIQWFIMGGDYHNIHVY